MNNNDRSASDLISPQRRIALKATVAGLFFGLGGAILPVRAGVGPDDVLKRKVLIAYFSRTGNTRDFAEEIQERVGGDLFEIRTVHPYPKEYRATTAQAKREQEENFRPQLASEVPNIESYDIVFVGYPTWRHTLPMALFSFLENYDFSGKTLIPFCTHEGTEFGNSVADMRSISPNSTVLEGLALYGGTRSSVKSDASLQEIDAWLQKLAVVRAYSASSPRI